VLSIEDIEPPIAFIRLSIIPCINIFNKMNTPNMTAKDIGNGKDRDRKTYSKGYS
jgi:hypothetical protein